MQSIIAAEVGYHELALRYFHDALYVDLAEPARQHRRRRCTSPRRAACGAALVYGFGGMRDHDGRLSFDPRLPDGLAVA